MGTPAGAARTGVAEATTTAAAAAATARELLRRRTDERDDDRAYGYAKEPTPHLYEGPHDDGTEQRTPGSGAVGARTVPVINRTHKTRTRP
jgi:hypothetical protein